MMGGKCGQCGYEDAAEGLVIALGPEGEARDHDGPEDPDMEGTDSFAAKIADIERKLAELKRMQG